MKKCECGKEFNSRYGMCETCRKRAQRERARQLAIEQEADPAQAGPIKHLMSVEGAQEPRRLPAGETAKQPPPGKCRIPGTTDQYWTCLNNSCAFRNGMLT